MEKKEKKNARADRESWWVLKNVNMTPKPSSIRHDITKLCISETITPCPSGERRRRVINWRVGVGNWRKPKRLTTTKKGKWFNPNSNHLVHVHHTLYPHMRFIRFSLCPNLFFDRMKKYLCVLVVFQIQITDIIKRTLNCLLLLGRNEHKRKYGRKIF